MSEKKTEGAGDQRGKLIAAVIAGAVLIAAAAAAFFLFSPDSRPSSGEGAAVLETAGEAESEAVLDESDDLETAAEPETVDQQEEENEDEAGVEGDIDGVYFNQDHSLTIKREGDDLVVSGYLPSGLVNDSYIAFDEITTVFTGDGSWAWDVMFLEFCGDYALLSYATEGDVGASVVYVKEGTEAAGMVPSQIDFQENERRLEAAREKGAAKLDNVGDYAGNPVWENLEVYCDTEPNSSGVYMPLCISADYQWTGSHVEFQLDYETGRVYRYTDLNGTWKEEPKGTTLNALAVERYELANLFWQIFQVIEGVESWDVLGWTVEDTALLVDGPINWE